MRKSPCAPGGALLLLCLLAAPGAAQDGPAANSEQIRFFETKIRPLLATHCVKCHGPEKQKSGLRLDSLSGMLLGGKAGPAVVPGKPKSSLLVTAVSYRDNDLRMPPKAKLPARDIADLTRWVEKGAPHPDAGKVKVARRGGINIEEGRRHWAFRPPAKPKVPCSNGAGANPIDAFIQAALDAKGIRPLGRADKRALIRRATFDLLGLPPTPEEIEAFLADESEGAFDRVVDRLLASPHYGERWGRHWLDIARYADSNGMDENLAHGNAWRYRDYVVRSLNDDKPYGRFLVEQLAGDLLDHGDDVARKRDHLIATGFLSLGPKVLAEVDEAKMEMDIVDEQLDSVGRSLMAVTLGCARCHDHKFDPIGQDDYYGLAGIFKSTRTMESFKKIARWNEHSLASPEELARKKEHDGRVAAKKKEIDERIKQAKAALTPPPGKASAKEVEKRFPKETKAALKALRAELEKLKESAPVMPAAMGVAEGKVADTSIHLRGSHLTLGDAVSRRFPRVFGRGGAQALPKDRSGRLEFARWLTDGNHPLTARVMVNRIWRWHFGRGIVPTVDNFGLQGDRPTHPKLLDWLAVRFVEDGWSLKAMHRLIMSSEAYRRASGTDAGGRAADPGNRLYWRFDVRRLEAEAIRDALLAISGRLDRTIGGSLLTVKNREFVFNHTSQDKSSYDIRRRSIYVPVIRNHLYDMFQIFDYSDASVLSGNRDTSTVSPQALFLMNSELVVTATSALAGRLLKEEPSRSARTTRLFLEAYGRPPTAKEADRVGGFLDRFRRVDDGKPLEDAWQALCQAIVSSSEFVYVR